MKRTTSSVLFLLVGSVAGCSKDKPAPPAPPADVHSVDVAPDVPAPPAHGDLSRQEFNQAAVRLNLPLYWTEDRNKNKQVDPDEIVTLSFYPTNTQWTADGKFTSAFDEAWTRMKTVLKDPFAGLTLTPEESARRKIVLEELDQGRATLVRTDLRTAPAGDKKFVEKMLVVAGLIDKLYAHAGGVDVLAAKVPGDDAASQSLFRRNWGPRCEGPKTEKNPLCSGIPGAPHPQSDMYPASLQTDGTNKFCATIEKAPNAAALITPFTVVREKDGKFIAVPYTQAYTELMQQISVALMDAAGVVVDPAEAALKAYLEAAAKSYTTNDWNPADEAWAKMNALNSKWYVRVAPDETYWEPCNHKAGFHMTFARINRDSIAWQTKLSPLRQEMEQTLATLIGPSYKVRTVDFHLPDFIDIVINAGDDRDAFGATVGQSLPNWGPVAEGRGRTVVMSNLYTDPDSLASHQQLVRSMLSTESAAAVTTEAGPSLVGTILHEATHNLGPAHEYKVKGKTDEQLFGGGLSAMFEELKAQTGALYYVSMLQKKELISEKLAHQVYADSVVWLFGHISRGMYTDTGQRKPYSQLAAVQLGFLLTEGAVTFDAAVPAANGTDKGSFSFHFDKFPAAAEKLMKIVGGIKARGDRVAAEALAKQFVDGTVVPQAMIAERMLRSPKVSFVYAIEL